MGVDTLVLVMDSIQEVIVDVTKSPLLTLTKCFLEQECAPPLKSTEFMLVFKRTSYIKDRIIES